MIKKDCVIKYKREYIFKSILGLVIFMIVIIFIELLMPIRFYPAILNNSPGDRYLLGICLIFGQIINHIFRFYILIQTPNDKETVVSCRYLKRVATETSIIYILIYPIFGYLAIAIGLYVSKLSKDINTPLILYLFAFYAGIFSDSFWTAYRNKKGILGQF